MILNNKEKCYFVETYLVSKLVDFEYVIQTKNNIVITENKKIYDFLIYLEENKIFKLSESFIIEYFKELPENEIKKLFDFFLINKIISFSHDMLIDFEKINLISNSEKFNIVFESFFNNYIDVCCYDLEKINDIEVENNNINIVFMNPFNYKKFVNIVDITFEKKILTKYIIYYNYSIYILNFNSKKINNPCPKCFFLNLESSIRNIGGCKGNNFQTIIDMIYMDNVNFKIEQNLLNFEMYKIMDVLFYQINDLKNKNNYVVNEVVEIKLNNLDVIKDKSCYWELCDCYVR